MTDITPSDSQARAIATIKDWFENRTHEMHLFGRDAAGDCVLDETASERRLVCRAGNPFGLPAKDRSGRLDVTEPPDLGALLAKINTTTGAAPCATPSAPAALAHLV